MSTGQHRPTPLASNPLEVAVNGHGSDQVSRPVYSQSGPTRHRRLRRPRERKSRAQDTRHACRSGPRLAELTIAASLQHAPAQLFQRTTAAGRAAPDIYQGRADVKRGVPAPPSYAAFSVRRRAARIATSSPCAPCAPAFHQSVGVQQQRGAAIDSNSERLAALAAVRATQARILIGSRARSRGGPPVSCRSRRRSRAAG